MTLKKVVSAFLSLGMIFSGSVTVFAYDYIFKGYAGTEHCGEAVAVGIYRSTADLSALQGSDILYMEQTSVDEYGYYHITVPLASASTENAYDMYSTTGNNSLYSSENYAVFYVSPTNGSDTNDGKTSVKPLQTLEAALRLSENNSRIVLLETVSLTDSFTWPSINHNITIDGEGIGKLDISNVGEFNINSAVIFTNMEFITRTVDNNGITPCNTIVANGNHVVLSDSVTTSTVASIIGGSTRQQLSSTNLEVYGGFFKTIYGGSTNQPISGDVHLTVGGYVNAGYSAFDNDTNYFASAVHGGSWGAVVGGNIYTTLCGDANIAYLYGSCMGQNLGILRGEAFINVTSGNCMNVYGCSGNTSSQTTRASINITGGTVESVFGGSDNMSVVGRVNIKISGGEIKRRIYGGCYNDWGFGFDTDYYVQGRTNIIIDGNPALCTADPWNSGIFGGSRCETHHSDEINSIIFLNNTYDTYKHLIGEIGSITVNNSHHNFITDVKTNGAVLPTETNMQIKLIPDTNYSALVNNVLSTDEYYAVPDGELVSVSFEQSFKINNVTSSADNSSVSANVLYNADNSSGKAASPVIITAIYNSGKSLIDAQFKDAKHGINQSDNFAIDCTLIPSGTYYIQSMLWDTGNSSMTPLTDAFCIRIP